MSDETDPAQVTATEADLLVRIGALTVERDVLRDRVRQQHMIIVQQQHELDELRSKNSD